MLGKNADVRAAPQDAPGGFNATNAWHMQIHDDHIRLEFSG